MARCSAYPATMIRNSSSGFTTGGALPTELTDCLKGSKTTVRIDLSQIISTRYNNEEKDSSSTRYLHGAAGPVSTTQKTELQSHAIDMRSNRWEVPYLAARVEGNDHYDGWMVRLPICCVRIANDGINIQLDLSDGIIPSQSL